MIGVPLHGKCHYALNQESPVIHPSLEGILALETASRPVNRPEKEGYSQTRE
jgi:hypothetical protein